MAAPGESGRAAYQSGAGFNDARKWAFRHGGKGKGGSEPGEYKGHIGFFDGHVEIMTDGDATDPDFWFPTATLLVAPLETWQYTRTKWARKTLGLSQTSPYRVQ